MRKLFFIFAFAPLLCASCLNTEKNTAAFKPQAPGAEYNRLVEIGKTRLRIQIAETDADMRRGLSGREFMPEDAGMLFYFKKPESSGFWMKGMKFNLDFIWIASSTVVGITPSVPSPVKDQRSKIKDSDLPNYYPPQPADMVLEVNEGWAERNGINVGDRVTLN